MWFNIYVCIFIKKEENNNESEDKYIGISFYTRDISEEDLNEKSKDGKSLLINKNIIDKVMQSRGRLDLYAKAYAIHCYLHQMLNKNNDFLIAFQAIKIVKYKAMISEIGTKYSIIIILHKYILLYLCDSY